VTDSIAQGLALISQMLEIAGVSALVLGFIVATTIWIRHIQQQGLLPSINQYRQSLGRTIMIGLEVLVAATIIKTISVNPTLESMGLLAFMVVIRTIIGWTTVLEISGRWPWQKSGPETVDKN
jgi:uncharacterized membrane protein